MTSGRHRQPAARGPPNVGRDRDANGDVRPSAEGPEAAFRTRRLDHIAFPSIYLDANYLRVSNTASQVTSLAVVIATGITTVGEREVLGVEDGDSEDDVF